MMDGKTVLVTGGTGGIGKETARGLARLGADVIIVGREATRARAAVDELQAGARGVVTALTADVTKQRDLHELADQVIGRIGRLDVLINNAGVTRERRELTEDGVETTFAGNVVAPYLLTHRLLPLLTGGRVINITGGIPRGRIDLDNLQGERSYVGLPFYNQTKLAQMAMTYTFAGKLADCTLTAAYPGHAYTSMNRDLAARAYPVLARPVVPLLRLLLPLVYGRRAVVRASRSSVHIASTVDTAALHGAYVSTSCRPTTWPAAARDPRNRDAIWTLCADLTGVPQKR